MAGTLNIPLTTLAPGTYNFGPANVADADSVTRLSVNRNVTGGLNSLSAAVTVSIEVWQSDDSGASWYNLATAGLVGGPGGDSPKTPGTNSVEVKFAPGTGRQARAVITVSGGSVAVSGTLTTS